MAKHFTICRWCNQLFAYEYINEVSIPITCEACKKKCTCSKDRMSEMSCPVHGVSAQLSRSQME